ncbi:hypothetical protein GCM10009637_11110 [Brevibacterium luteolum]
MTEQPSPYGSGSGTGTRQGSAQPQTPASPQPAGRVRIRHLQEYKQQGSKWAMLTSYDQLSAGLFDEAGIPVLLVGCGGQQRLRLRDHAAGHRRRAHPARAGRDRQHPARACRRRPALRLLPGIT